MFIRFIQQFGSVHKVQCEQIRLDKFIWQCIGGTWSNTQKLVREGYVKYNGIKLKDQTYKLKRGEIVELNIKEIQRNNEMNQSQNAFEFSKNYQNQLINRCEAYEQFKQMIIYEDDDYLVINKDYGICSQGGQEKDRNLPNMMSNYLIETGQTQSVFRIVHRLDQMVSGLMFTAKNTKSARDFSRLLENRIYIQKEYICVVQGCPIKPSGIIDAPLLFNTSKQKSQLSNYCDENHKQCKTEYELIFTNDVYSVLRVRLIDGRKHQIRAHLSKVLKTPILFDGLYGFNYKLENFRKLQQDINCTGIMLHSRRTTIQQKNYEIIKKIAVENIQTQKGVVEEFEDGVVFVANYPESMKQVFKYINFQY